MSRGGNYQPASPTMRHALDTPKSGKLGHKKALADSACQRHIRLYNSHGSPRNRFLKLPARSKPLASSDRYIELSRQHLITGIVGSALWQRLLKPIKSLLFQLTAHAHGGAERISAITIGHQFYVRTHGFAHRHNCR